MLTRLRVSGFKNLVDVDVYFGPFTCVAGANGIGKSNLFDAIRFLSALADRTLIDAALSVRDEGGRTADVRSIFHRVGDTYAETMSFEAEMIVPASGEDDLGQEATASITFLKYAVAIGYRADGGSHSLGSLQLLREELAHIKLGDANKHLLFPHSAKHWRASAVRGRRFGTHFISTEGDESHRVIRLHQDGGVSRGRAVSRPGNLPRTVLSVANSDESPTALLARREMQSWRLLQLEPSALRRPDEFTAPPRLGFDGSHLPSTLYHLARVAAQSGPAEEAGARESSVYARIANRLAELIEDVRDVGVDRDERRELLTLQVRGRDGTVLPARALSDGTLRFLALTILELDPNAQGLICLEEPENGIHPGRIPAMIRLLRDITTDVFIPVDDDNPLRQVIVNTHSPAVVAQVPEDSLVIAEARETVQNGKRFERVCFSALESTWRQRAPGAGPPVAKGRLMAYLNPVEYALSEMRDRSSGGANGHRIHGGVRRVVDRDDLQMMLPIDPPAG